MSLSLLFTAICFSAFLAWIFRFKSLSSTTRFILVFALICALFTPIKGLAMAGYLRGIISDLSITTVIISVLSLVNLLAGKTLISEQEYKPLYYSIPIFALFFYPTSLGLTYFDPYAFGYQPGYLLIGLLGVALGLWWKKYYILLMILLIDLWAFNLEILDSDNLWDYLVDPILVIYCLVQMSFLIPKRTGLTPNS